MSGKHLTLFAWQPNGHGPRSYFVMAESVSAARAAIERHVIEQHRRWPESAMEWDFYFRTEAPKSLPVDEVVSNDND